MEQKSVTGLITCALLLVAGVVCLAIGQADIGKLVLGAAVGGAVVPQPFGRKKDEPEACSAEDEADDTK